MFFYILKTVRARKFLRAHSREERPPEAEGFHTIAAVACIVNMDEVEDIAPLLSLAETFGLEDRQFTVLAYTKTPRKYEDSALPLFSLKDFTWKLDAKEEIIRSFLTGEYTLLINYFTKEKLPLLYISARIRAKLRVGFEGTDPHYNDLIFKIPVNNPALFKNELIKYVNILKTPA